MSPTSKVILSISTVDVKGYGKCEKCYGKNMEKSGNFEIEAKWQLCLLSI